MSEWRRLSFQFRVGDDKLNADYRPLHKEVILSATPSAVPTWRWREEIEEQFGCFLDDVERWAQRRMIESRLQTPTSE
jgi:hypothetical protein